MNQEWNLHRIGNKQNFACNHSFACCLLHAEFLLSLQSHPENWGNTLHSKVDLLSED
jgi:hypothetical protein